MLPVLIGDKIESPAKNEVWQLVLQLRQIAELICAGKIAYLEVLINEYLHTRCKAFPNHTLKPKHRYITHFPELIFHFGP